jgi:hypothetical protein
MASPTIAEPSSAHSPTTFPKQEFPLALGVQTSVEHWGLTPLSSQNW